MINEERLKRTRTREREGSAKKQATFSTRRGHGNRKKTSVSISSFDDQAPKCVFFLGGMASTGAGHDKNAGTPLTLGVLSARQIVGPSLTWIGSYRWSKYVCMYGKYVSSQPVVDGVPVTPVSQTMATTATTAQCRCFSLPPILTFVSPIVLLPVDDSTHE